jgi:SAM-dependent methyltransferase
MMSYHPYVFDEKKRTFVGRFEDMYQAEREQGFDSWHQEDSRNLTRRICLEILDAFNFTSVLDVGCGKGAFTHQLKKQNNHIVGIDVSRTALEAAKARFPDIEFLQRDLAVEAEALSNSATHFDLVVCLETLSYLENWRALLEQFSRIAEYALTSLYLPENPIGFVKAPDDLAAEFRRHFNILEDVRVLSRGQTVFFGMARR